jgi:hypothetical protein
MLLRTVPWWLWRLRVSPALWKLRLCSAVLWKLWQLWQRLRPCLCLARSVLNLPQRRLRCEWASDARCVLRRKQSGHRGRLSLGDADAGDDVCRSRKRDPHLLTADRVAAGRFARSGRRGGLAARVREDASRAASSRTQVAHNPTYGLSPLRNCDRSTRLGGTPIILDCCVINVSLAPASRHADCQLSPSGSPLEI